MYVPQAFNRYNAIYMGRDVLWWSVTKMAATNLLLWYGYTVLAVSITWGKMVDMQAVKGFS